MSKNIDIICSLSLFLYKILKPLEKHRFTKIKDVIEEDNLSVLDIGCSDGAFLYKNKNLWKRIVGIDRNEISIRKARRRKYDVPAKFYIKNVGRSLLPCRTGEFDLVTSIATLQYILDIDLLLSEVHRVLRSGGQFIVEVPNIAVFWRRIELLLGTFPNVSYLRDDLKEGVIHYFTLTGLSTVLRKKGFTIKRVSCSGIFDKLRNFWVSFLGADLIFVCQKL